MKLHTNGRGFTVIELLVVVAIIAMIASFVYTSTLQVKAKARDVRREEDIKQIQTALDLYAVSFRRFPDCGAQAVVIGSGTDVCFSNALTGAGAISGLPTDPIGGAGGSHTNCGVSAGVFIYCYTSFNGGSSYEINYQLETATIPGKPQGWQIPVTP